MNLCLVSVYACYLDKALSQCFCLICEQASSILHHVGCTSLRPRKSSEPKQFIQAACISLTSRSISSLSQHKKGHDHAI